VIIRYNLSMDAYRSLSEGRHDEINFSGTDFLFMRKYESRDANYPFEIALHKHEWHEFVWSRSPGSLSDARHVLTMDGIAYPYGDSTLIYVPPFHPHKFMVARPLAIWVIGIDQNQAVKVFAHSPISRPLERRFASWRRLPPSMAAGEDPVRNPKAQALDELTASYPCRGSMESLDAIHFLVTLDRIVSTWEEAGSKPEASGEGEVVQAAMEYLEKNFDRAVGVAECAARIGVARSTLSHQFRASTGQSVPRWLAEVRLRHARALLVETDLDIIDVALECGFNDPAWFSRKFKLETGMPPSEWRNKSRTMLNTPSPMHDRPER
jgi:AraC-like DNA-binding protein